MASKNKWKKMKNARSHRGFALKESKLKMKRRLFFNSSMRKKLNNPKNWDN